MAAPINSHIKIGLLLLLFVCTSFLSFAQTEEASTETEDEPKKEKYTPEPLELNFKPTIGLGIGMLTFYGDVAENNKNFHPTVSRVGYDLNISNPINRFLDLNFYVLHGTTAANERTLDRNLNFESRITSGGLNLSYNFDHFLRKDRPVEPFFFTGIEAIEFNSKTDLFDADGNPYNYWSDGSIRSLPENDPNAESAVEVFRDYTYETDLRSLNLDGFGNYQERTWAIPVGIGATFLISESVSFKVGTSMHFTFTDFIDNVTAESVGNRAGTSGNDKFLYTSFSLRYNLQLNRDEKDTPGPIELDEELFASDETYGDDSDGDLIIDFLDECPGTPADVEVDERGCPVDFDKDGIPDHLDDEMDTELGAYVDDNGVTVEDTVFWLAYAKFIDSTGAYVEYTEQKTSGGKAIPDPNRVAAERSYFVEAGGTEKALPKDVIDYILSLPDVETRQEDGKVIYEIGDYSQIEDAVMQQIDLANRAVPSSVGGTEGDRELSPEEIAEAVESVDISTLPISNKTIFRVQLGAFRLSPSSAVFDDVGNLVIVQGEDGLTRYLSGSFDNLQKAADHKINLLTQGFPDAFIVAYRSGKRISLEQAGATIVSGSDQEPEDVSAPAAVDKSRIKFRVQIGAFENEVPTDILDVYLKLGNVDARRQGNLTKYLIGTYDTYEEASNAKGNIEGVQGAFVVGQFNGNIISAEEAKNLLEQ